MLSNYCMLIILQRESGGAHGRCTQSAHTVGATARRRMNGPMLLCSEVLMVAMHVLKGRARARPIGKEEILQ